MSMLAIGFAGAVAALVISLAAWRLGALSGGGAIAATICGTVAAGAGWDWAVLLVAFFVSSTLLSRLRARERAQRLEGRIAKSGARDAAQVFANGAAFVASALGAWVHAHPAWQALGAAGLAASSSDTWATEIGTLARARPRSIVDGRVVDVGASGGVTVQGLVAAFAGAVFIAVVALLLGWPARAAVAALAGGVLGSAIDSLLGASLQARRWCDLCGMATEQEVHRCGTATRMTGGIRWLNNDGVNAISSVAGALLGGSVASLV